MSDRNHRLAVLLLGHGAFLTLLVLSLEHGLLRSTFGDTAYQVFKWISQPGVSCEAHRYTAVLPQLVIKGAMWLGADLPTLLILASVAHALVGYAVFVWCAHAWKAPIAALGCAGAAVLCSRLAFYSPALEANYLLCYPFLLVGFVEWKMRSGDFPDKALITAILLSLISLVVHPAGWMVMLFIITFLAILGWLPRKVTAALGALTLGWPLIARSLFPPTAYEAGHYAALEDGLRHIGGMTGWASLDFLVMHTFTASHTYLPALVVVVALVVGWWSIGARWLGVVSLAGVLAFVLVFLIAFHQGDAAVMMDRGVLPVATIIGLSASALALRMNAGRLRLLALIIVAGILFIKVRDVSFASRSFAGHMARVDRLSQQALDAGVRRGLVDCVDADPTHDALGWALPVESLLRSSAKDDKRSVVLTCANASPTHEELREDEIMVIGLRWRCNAAGNDLFGPVPGPARPVDP